MAQISSSVGLISGINTGAIISQLLQIARRPVTILQGRVTGAQNQQKAYGQLSTGLNSIQTIAHSLALPQTFDAATANSSDSSVLSATASVGAAVGSYQLQVAQLVTTQQSITQGFANTGSALVGAGTLTLQQGGGEASSQTALSALNGGAGVTRGQFRITDRSGNSAVIDTSNAVTLNDVVHDINNAINVNVKATITNQGLVLTDQTGKTASDLIVQDLGGGSAATSLGLAGDVAGTVLTGKTVNYLSSQTALSQLNDGNGIAVAGAAKNDFAINARDGSVINVSLSSAQSVGDVIAAINTAGGSKVKASITAGSTHITLTDTSGGGGAFTVTALNSSKAAAGLGLTAAAAGSTITGNAVLAGLDSVLISSLRGGTGLNLGTISITDANGISGVVNLAGAVSFSDIINTINATNKTNSVLATASLNAAGTGIQITDNSGGAGALTISDGSSTTAAELGIAGTAAAGQTTLSGVNLQRQYVSGNTLLSDYHGGKGVDLGQFTLTNSNSLTTTIDLSKGTYNTIGDVIAAINSAGAGVTASINANGNGILLTDTAGGAAKLTVASAGGSSTAGDLNIVGTATGTTIDGALEKTIAITSSDTLASVQTKINQAGFGVTATLINDGSGANPWRLSLSAINSGSDGRVIIDGGATNLNPTTLVAAQDAAVFFGGNSGSTQPLLVTSHNNQIANLIKGVTVNLVSASATPVTLSVTNDPSSIVKDLSDFTNDFNTLVNQIGTDTNYNTSTNTAGLLLGDSTINQVQQSIYNMTEKVVTGAGPYKSLADLGITITTGALLSFDPAKFQAAFAANPAAVQNFFSQTTTGMGAVMSNAVAQLTDPVSGVITLQTNMLTTQIQQFQDSITQLNKVLADSSSQLEAQFANMEQVLAGLQTQQSALGTLTQFNSLLTATKTGTSSSTTGAGSTSNG